MSATNETRVPVCYGRTVGRNFVQEWYETASRDAGRRTRELKRAGWRALSSTMGDQVTDVGRVRMTLVTVFPAEGQDTADCPAPARLVRV